MKQQSPVTDKIEHNTESMNASGSVKSVRGSVVDVVFQGQLPQINQMLMVGHKQHIVLEVTSYLNEKDVRCIAFHSTEGLERGAPEKEKRKKKGSNLCFNIFVSF